jgi:hypothetical protein
MSSTRKITESYISTVEIKMMPEYGKYKIEKHFLAFDQGSIALVRHAQAIVTLPGLAAASA